MDLKKLINKLLAREELNALEQSELENFDFNRISGENMEKLQYENESLHRELHQLRHDCRMQKLCAEFHCTDPDYLEFCARRSNVDTGDDEAMRRFAAELAKSSPGCFTAHIVPGSNAGNCSASTAAAGSREAAACDRIGAIAASISDAPDAL